MRFGDGLRAEECVGARDELPLPPSAREAGEVCHNAVCVSDCLTCVDTPSVAGCEPFARGFRSVGARLEEDAYLGAFGEVEVAGCVAFEGGADTLGESLLRLHYDVAVALIDVLPAVADRFFF